MEIIKDQHSSEDWHSFISTKNQVALITRCLVFDIYGFVLGREVGGAVGFYWWDSWKEAVNEC